MSCDAVSTLRNKWYKFVVACHISSKLYIMCVHTSYSMCVPYNSERILYLAFNV